MAWGEPAIAQIRRPAKPVYQWMVTFDDPIFFTEPFTFTRNITR
jgi:hypothetical protein